VDLAGRNCAPVAGALSIVLDVNAQKRLPGTGTRNVDAYDALLAGRALGRVGNAE